MFDDSDDVEQTRKDLCWLMECLVQRDMSYLSRRPTTPRLYKSGVRYEMPKQFAGVCLEVAILKKALGRAARNVDVARILDLVQAVLGGEHFVDIGVLLEKGSHDCDSLACWRAAELRQYGGIEARPYMTHRTRLDGGITYHALVLWPPIPGVPYETSEDPSLLLGMGGEAKAAERQAEIQKNAERCEILRDAKLGRSQDGEIAALEEALGLKASPRGGQKDEIAQLLSSILGENQPTRLTG